METELFCFFVTPKTKKRIAKACRDLKISYEEFLERALVEAEMDAIIKECVSDSSKLNLKDEKKLFRKKDIE